MTQLLEEWPRPLSRRTAPIRLNGVDVYYDFDWEEIFSHNRSTFRNGQALACLVSRDCPDGLAPTLLLTSLADQEDRTHRTEDRYIAVVQIQKYLAIRGADPAATYFAQDAGTPVTDLKRFSTLSSDDVSALLDTQLNVEELEAWIDRDYRHRESLVELLTRRPGLAESLEGSMLLPDQIRALAELDTDVIEAFLDYMNRVGWPEEVRIPVVSAAAATPEGSAEIGEALGKRLPERLEEIRRDAMAYRELIQRPETGETAVQEFIEKRPWLVGLEYHRVRGRPPVLRGETDFILDRFDGYYDILELKSPSDAIIKEAQPRRADRPPSPSQYRLGRSLSLALAQAHLYRHILGSLSPESAEQLGLPYHRHPEVTILIGRKADLSDTGLNIVTQLNLSLVRVQVIPFDQLGQRIEGIVSNIERLLTRGGIEAE